MCKNRKWLLPWKGNSCHWKAWPWWEKDERRFICVLLHQQWTCDCKYFIPNTFKTTNTWQDPSGKVRNQIDFILIKNGGSNLWKRSKTLSGANVGSCIGSSPVKYNRKLHTIPYVLTQFIRRNSKKKKNQIQISVPLVMKMMCLLEWVQTSLVLVDGYWYSLRIGRKYFKYSIIKKEVFFNRHV